MRTTGENCEGCGAPASKGLTQCSYCDRAYPVTEPQRKERRSDGNIISYAENCVIIGDGNIIASHKDTEVQGCGNLLG